MTFSGGLNPLAWLSLATGRHLLALAQRNEGNYYRIGGSSVAMGYPHATGQLPDDVTNIDGARVFWHSEHPELSHENPYYQKLASRRSALLNRRATDPRREERKDYYLRLLKELEDALLPYDIYARGPTTERMYDTLSTKLGCVAAGDPKRQWRCFRRDPKELGRSLVNGASDSRLLSSSFQQFDDALARAKLAHSSDGRVVPYHHFSLISQTAVTYLPWSVSSNPFAPVDPVD